MAVLDLQVETSPKQTSNPLEIAALMATEGLVYARWTLPADIVKLSDSQVLELYQGEIATLKASGAYLHSDLVALTPQTPRLGEICSKFVREHHHEEDEVRFTVAGEGVFEIQRLDGDGNLKITTEPGDLIVIPAFRRHLFYLTPLQHIRCIRLFQDAKGWEAIYEEAAQTKMEGAAAFSDQQAVDRL